ncbi:LysR family transcriptional regulator [Sphingomonas spermidinifaciens]|uniref:LysR family transcriptional regulator n=1 Tax=Sphingomonas spermidinifaciens TaxID=1141889 RepID=A0A2A4B3I2_9SPHN|nr:LysR family transcriptional regulator [Sphingomonas spermidinifaciens]PCD02244.1 LysR family transcriptional regulator [Sphingomonas spermidinifaciens]
MIEVHLLRYALAAADSGSFSQAADRFGIKQSTLSKRIHYLEDRLGLALFRRSTRGVVPTGPGECILRKARRIVDDIDALDEDCAAIACGAAGTLRFGFHGSLGSGDLSAVIRDFRAACPEVELAARERSRTRLLRALERDQLDFAVLNGQVQRPGIVSLSFWSEQVIIGLSTEDRLCACDPLYWTDLRGMTFVVSKIDPGPFLYDLVASRLSGPGFGPSVRVQDVRRENLFSFAAAGRAVVTTGIPGANDGVALRQVHDAFGATHLEQAIHWRCDNRSPVLRRFLEMLAHRYGRPVPAL